MANSHANSKGFLKFAKNANLDRNKARHVLKPTSVIVSIADWEPVMSEWENEQKIAEQVLDDLRISQEQFARGEYHSTKEVFDMMQRGFGL